jgi:hypothetical protein
MATAQPPTPPQQQEEMVPYGVVLEYWQTLTMELHNRLAMAEAQIKMRDEALNQLKAQLTNQQIGG